MKQDVFYVTDVQTSGERKFILMNGFLSEEERGVLLVLLI